MLPNFFIAGSPRCGTTSLYYILKQHPEIAFPDEKEPKYFSSLGLDLPQQGPGDETVHRKIVSTWADYQNLYSKINAKRVGDASSPCLYYYEFSAPAIKERLGDIPIIVMLRNPSERAYSAWNNLVRDSRETESFAEALDLEKERIANNYDMMWAYQEMGLYAKQVAAYQQTFSRVKVLIFEEFAEAPEKVLREVFDFLEINPDFQVDTSEKYSHSGKPKNKLFTLLSNRNNKVTGDIRKWMMRIIPRKYLERLARYMFAKDDLPDNVRTRLANYFRSDIVQLEKIIQKDLSIWK